MATEAQVCVNRLNAQKSTGPRTPEGKAGVAQNAVKHGLLARAAVLQGEEWEEYTCYHEEMLEELYPDGMQEMELAQRIVSLSWRLKRAARYQNAVFEALYDKYAADPPEPCASLDPRESIASDPTLGRMLLEDFSRERVLERVLLYERRIESSLYRTMNELRQLRRQPQTAVKRTATAEAFRGPWEGSSRHSPASPFATSDFPFPTSNSTLSASDESVEESVGQGPSYTEEVGRGRPTLDQMEGRLYEEGPQTRKTAFGNPEPPAGVTTNTPADASPAVEIPHHSTIPSFQDSIGATPAADQSCETNPIWPDPNDAQVPYSTEVMSDSAQDGLGKTKPVSEEKGEYRSVVPSVGRPVPV